MIETILALISLLLAIIAVLIRMVWTMLIKKIDEMVSTQTMFIEETKETKRNISAIMSWIRSHEKLHEKIK